MRIKITKLIHRWFNHRWNKIQSSLKEDNKNPENRPCNFHSPESNPSVLIMEKQVPGYSCGKGVTEV